MSKKNNETKSKSNLKYVIIIACIALIVIVGICLGQSLNSNTEPPPLPDFQSTIGIDVDKLNLIESSRESKGQTEDAQKVYAKFDIASLSPKRFIVQNYPNTTFYSLYENGYGYQYNSEKEVNEKNDYQSELKVLDTNITEAYWLEYDSHKVYLYFTENNGNYTAIVSNYAF